MRQIGFASGKGDWQLRAWVHIAEKDIRNRIRTFTTRVPGFNNAAYFIEPGHENSGAGFEYHDGSRIRRSNLTDKLILLFR
jgi:hypothetical protein